MCYRGHDSKDFLESRRWNVEKEMPKPYTKPYILFQPLVFAFTAFTFILHASISSPEYILKTLDDYLILIIYFSDYPSSSMNIFLMFA